MAYQFAHIYTYSKSGGKKGDFKVSGCLGEAFRDDGFCDHITNPEKNVSLAFGDRAAAEKAIQNYEDNFKDSRGHKLRKDGKALVAGVFSYPPGTTEEMFQERTEYLIKWLKKEYGSGLRCVLSHKDENFKQKELSDQIHYHTHFFVVPEITENIDKYHPGIAAKKKARADKKNKLGEDLAYKWAMGDWQDKINKELGQLFGLDRERPEEQKEKRLSRREYKILAAAEAIKDTCKEKENILNDKMSKTLEWEKSIAKQSAYLQEKEKQLQRREKEFETEIKNIKNSPVYNFAAAVFNEIKTIIPELHKKVLDTVLKNVEKIKIDVASEHMAKKGFASQTQEKDSKQQQ